MLLLSRGCQDTRFEPYPGQNTDISENLSRNMRPPLPVGKMKDRQRHAQDLRISMFEKVLSEGHLVKVLCHQLQ